MHIGGVSAQRAHSVHGAHTTRRNWGFSLQLAMFLPMKETNAPRAPRIAPRMHVHSFLVRVLPRGGRLLAFIRDPPPIGMVGGQRLPLPPLALNLTIPSL